MGLASLRILLQQLLHCLPHSLALRQVVLLCCAVEFSSDVVTQVDLLEPVLSLLEPQEQMVELTDFPLLEPHAVDEGFLPSS